MYGLYDNRAAKHYNNQKEFLEKMGTQKNSVIYLVFSILQISTTTIR